MVNDYKIVVGTVYLCHVTILRKDRPYISDGRFGVWSPNLYGIGDVTLYIGGGCNTIAYGYEDTEFASNVCSPGPAYARATWNGDLQAQTDTL